MHLDNTARLFEEFPDLFRRKQMVHGFECQDGWFGLIYELAERIRRYSVQLSGFGDFQVDQVRQIMGTLRVKVRGGDDIILKLIQDAEERSRTICELDGEPATGLFVCAPHWYRHLCEKCAELHGCMTIEDSLRANMAETSMYEQFQQME